MDDVFHLIKLGDGLGVRLWLDSIENDFNQWYDKKKQFKIIRV